MAGKSFGNELLDTPNGFTIFIGILGLIGLLLFLLHVAMDYLASNRLFENFGDKAGNIFCLIVFLGVMIKMNEQTLDIHSFCLMNNDESICQTNWTLLKYDPRNINCSAIYDGASNETSNVMVHYDGYSGFIKVNYSSETDFTRCSDSRIEKYLI